MLNQQRNPEWLFKSLDVLSNQSDKIELHFTGIISPDVKQSIMALTNLSNAVKFKDSVPHSMLKDEYSKADILLLLQTDTKESSSQLPGKLFEYLAQKKPILAFGSPESDVAKILTETNSGLMLAYDDKEGIEIVTQMIFNGEFGKDFSYEGVDRFSRRAVTQGLVELLESR